MKTSKWFSYENGMLLLLGFTFGIVFFERNAVGLLAPYIKDDLGLSNTEIGMLSSGLALAWAISAYFVSAWSDRSGVRKPFVLFTIIIFSICSAISGLATSFLFLLIARVVMGAAEGPFLPVCLSIMNVESSPHRRGLNAGIMQNVFAAILGTTMAPLVLVWLAELYDWRITFFLSGIPGLVCALLVWIYLREPKVEDTAPTIKPQAHSTFKVALMMLQQHNIRICALISIFMVAYFLIGLSFMSLVLTELRGFTPTQMGSIMAPMGVSTLICGFLVPGLSDRIGRKPVMIVFTFIGVVTPLAALYFDGSLTLMRILFFIGWSVTGSFPLFMGVIPGETVSRALAATSMGLVVSIGELIGGVGGPSLAGMLADQSSQAAPMILMVVCSVCAGLLSLFLTETAPKKLKQATATAAMI